MNFGAMMVMGMRQERLPVFRSRVESCKRVSLDEVLKMNYKYLRVDDMASVFQAEIGLIKKLDSEIIEVKLHPTDLSGQFWKGTSFNSTYTMDTARKIPNSDIILAYTDEYFYREYFHLFMFLKDARVLVPTDYIL